MRLRDDLCSESFHYTGTICVSAASLYQTCRLHAGSQSMKSTTILCLFVLLMGCTTSIPTGSGVTASPTACPTRKVAARATSAVGQAHPGTAQPSEGNAPAGDTGPGGPGTGSETPSPEQIATSQAMTDQSNKTGPDVEQGITQTPKAEPSGPGIPPPDASTNSSTRATLSPTHYLSEQPYPAETSEGNPCP